MGKLVAGPGVYICDECTGLCAQILAMEATPGANETAPQVSAWHERPDEELLTGLARVQAAISQVDAALHDHVDVLRAQGVSWTRIGAALGVSRQAAWERFSGED